VGGAQLDLQGERLLLQNIKGYQGFRQCRLLYDDMAQVPLNRFEQYNVKAIKTVEASKAASGD
jgi:hypothetical protein